jgi:hypothetical protein
MNDGSRPSADQVATVADSPVRSAVTKLLNALFECRVRWNDDLDRIEAAGNEIADQRREVLARARRTYAFRSLQAVIKFLADPGIRQGWSYTHLGLDVHLIDLSTTLLDLDLGRLPEMLKPHTNPKERISFSDTLLRVYAVVVVELLRKAGDSAREAERIIAERLDSIGYRTPRGKKSERGPGRITARTLQEWHKEVRTAPAGSMLRDCYQWVSEDMIPLDGTPEDFRGQANQICGYFLLYAPDTRAHYLRIGPSES